MNEIECPYCEHAYELDTDDGHGREEDILFEETCPKCEKMFVFDTHISFSHTAYKADCLNGSDHRYQHTHTYPIEFTKMECSSCQKTREPTDEEWEQILKERVKK